MELLPNRNKKTGKFIKGKVSLDNCMCITCGKGFHVPPYRLKVEVKYCSRKCKGMGWDTLGENHPAWKGGIELTKRGYILVRVLGHPFAGSRGRIYEHRLLMEKELGRYLNQDERVHHINGIKTDNRIENLMLFETHSKHMKLHNFNRDERGKFL